MSKLIVCSPQLGISPESNLGGEVYDREILKALDQLGVQSLIILPLFKKHPPYQHAKFYYLPLPVIYPPWLFNLLVLPYLFILYRKFHYSVLRVHSPYFIGPAALIFGLFNPKVKIVASYLHLEPENKLYDFIDRNIIERFSLITTISRQTKEEIVNKYDVGADKIAVIPCGVDVKYRPFPKNQKLVEQYHLENKKILLYLGQLIERKNIPFLFKVLKRLPENYVLLICGDGPLRQELEQIAPERVIFAGRIKEHEKVDYYNLADVFVYPSKKEGFGLSVAEALACGKKVIASNTPIVESTPLDIDAWVQSVLNPSRQKHLNYSWTRSAEKYEDLIRN